MLGAFEIAAADLTEPWKMVASGGVVTPRTWRLAAQLLALGFRGARVPSVQRPGGVNIVLWRWNDRPRGRVDALDPFEDLPRDQNSWPES